ncbi:MAG: hypothetical protein ACOCU6_03120 [Nanoarchaeota archaeon]
MDFLEELVNQKTEGLLFIQDFVDLSRLYQSDCRYIVSAKDIVQEDSIDWLTVIGETQQKIPENEFIHIPIIRSIERLNTYHSLNKIVEKQISTYEQKEDVNKYLLVSEQESAFIKYHQDIQSYQILPTTTQTLKTMFDQNEDIDNNIDFYNDLKALNEWVSFAGNT